MIALFALAGSAWAATLTGTVQYTDRSDDGSPFGPNRMLPVRYAQVSIAPARRGAGGFLTWIGAGYTDGAGRFEIDVEAGYDELLRVEVRALADGPGSPLRMVVRQPTTSLDHRWPGFTRGSIDTSQNTDLGTFTIPLSRSAPFNVLDVGLSGQEFLLTLEPGLSLGGEHAPTLWWPTGGSYYQKRGRAIHIARGDEFDDSVILHEVGHWAHEVFSVTDTPGGPHRVEELMDPRAAFSEGFAHWFSSATKQWLDDHLDRYAHPSWYLDRIATGRWGFDLEQPYLRDTRLQARTQSNELAVAAALWDVSDPINEDRAHDRVTVGPSPVWQALRDLRSHTESKTLGAWFRAFASRDAASAQRAAGTWSPAFTVDGLLEYVRIRFTPDNAEREGVGEPNDTLVQGWPLSEADLEQGMDQTLFDRDAAVDFLGDEDWYFLIGAPRPNATSAQITVRLEPIERGVTWSRSHRARMDDGADLMLRLWEVGDIVSSGLCEGVRNRDIDPTVECVLTVDDPDPSAGSWTPQITVQVLADYADDVSQFASFRLVGTID